MKLFKTASELKSRTVLTEKWTVVFAQEYLRNIMRLIRGRYCQGTRYFSVYWKLRKFGEY